MVFLFEVFILPSVGLMLLLSSHLFIHFTPSAPSIAALYKFIKYNTNLSEKYSNHGMAVMDVAIEQS